MRESLRGALKAHISFPHHIEFDLPCDLQHREKCSRLQLKQTKHNSSSTSSSTTWTRQPRETERQGSGSVSRSSLRGIADVELGGCDRK